MKQILISKSEILNKSQNQKFHYPNCLMFVTLEFKYCLGFGACDLGFISL